MQIVEHGSLIPTMWTMEPTTGAVDLFMDIFTLWDSPVVTLPWAETIQPVGLEIDIAVATT
jgi:hypothetical protein